MNAPAEPTRLAYERTRREHWDQLSDWKSPVWGGFNTYYHQRLAEIYRYLVPRGSRVLELGCGAGDLLAALEPAYGVGVDFSPRLLAMAAQRYPSLNFVEASAQDFASSETFDYILLSDLVNELWDVQYTLQNLGRFCGPQTRVVINTYSHLWQLPRNFAESTRLVSTLPPQNWLTREDLRSLLDLAGLESIRSWTEILWPFRTPLLDRFANRFMAKVWPFRVCALSNFIVARPKAQVAPKQLSVSIVVAARNEQGNISEIFRRTDGLFEKAELIFVEGNSSDDTFGEIERQMAANPHRKCKLFRQPGKGKGDAIRVGFANAECDVLMILDADMTVAPEDLPRFYDAIASGVAEFVNGVRLVYPMEKEAMRFFNLLGNKFFSLAFSWLLGQNIKDTLCGTKVLTRDNYNRIAAGRSYFGEFDPFGDFDLIFGAAKCNLKIVDMPIRYRERLYGETNINRWRDGSILLRMVAFAMFRIKFV